MVICVTIHFKSDSSKGRRVNFFLMALITTRFFLFRLKLKHLKKGGAKVFIVILFLSE